MPYFAWRGITLDGSIKKGKQCARSAHDLDVQLLKRDIALLKVRAISHTKFARLNYPILAHDFLHRLSVLLASGVLVPQALLLLANQHKKPHFQEVLFALAHDVHSGNSLREALEKYPKIFDAMVVRMVHVGQEIGSLDTALAMVVAHQQMIQNFKKQLRSAALMPCVTLLFFCASALTIFVVILPRFAALFKAANQQLPPLTRSILAVSDFLQSPAALLIPIMGGLSTIALCMYVRSARGKHTLDSLLLKLPFVHVLVRQALLAQWLSSLAMVLEGGVQLVPALKITQYGIRNACMQESIGAIIEQVEHGSSLSDAMLRDVQMFDEEIIALVVVGEESSKLEVMLAQAARQYQANVQRSLMLITTLFQPLLMIIMGLLITGLIFAIYVPVFNLAQVVG